MYEIKSRTIKIADEKVEVFSREIVSANILEVEAGTNGFRGGDGGHGSRTYFRLKNLGGTCFDFKQLDEDTIEFILYGDAELDTFIKALKFAVKVLEDQKNEVCD